MTTRPTKAERVQAIRDAAAVREALDQGALYARLADGSHEITWRGGRVTGATVAEAIEAAKGVG